MPKEYLTRCLKCGYNLTGLPPQHRCPECGLKYDKQLPCWRPHQKWLWLVIPGVALLVLMAIKPAGEVLRGLLSFTWPGWWNVILFSLLGILVYGSISWVVALCRKMLFVAITPDGILSETSAGWVLVPWDHVPRDLSEASNEDAQAYRKKLALWSTEIFDNTATSVEFGAHVATAQRLYLEPTLSDGAVADGSSVERMQG